MTDLLVHIVRRSRRAGLAERVEMSASCQFYLDQAALCAKSAERATLANQRETYVRAGAAWQALADREIDITIAREKRDAEKVARQIEPDLVAGRPDTNALFGAASGGETR
ncbi:hypothetical protein AQZ49_05995 [Novosphingobium sp. FSW06-99]|nr:hypothetical protein AQZ49_05995 [Novosphingobium sp. FSW06-99]